LARRKARSRADERGNQPSTCRRTLNSARYRRPVLVPIRLTRAEIAALERHHGIRLLPDGAPADQTITGHIDFLQVRHGAVHILDYKFDARTNRPFAQLTIYALALTRLAGFAASISNAPGSTRTITANSSRARCSPIRTETRHPPPEGGCPPD
jgi:hypothetical protein